MIPNFLSKGVIYKSVSLFVSSPHTGWQDYQDGVKRIPTACITVEDAELMWRIAQRGQQIVVRLTMAAKTLPDADSFNTVAEIRGWQHPEQVPVCLNGLFMYLIKLQSLFLQSFSVGANLLGWACQIHCVGVLLDFWRKDINMAVLLSLLISFSPCLFLCLMG